MKRVCLSVPNEVTKVLSKIEVPQEGEKPGSTDPCLAVLIIK